MKEIIKSNCKGADEAVEFRLEYGHPYEDLKPLRP